MQREVSVEDIVNNISKSKVIILIITLVMTMLSIAYVLTDKPTYDSTAIIELGQYDDLNYDNVKKIIEPPTSLIENLTVMFSFKNNKYSALESKKPVFKILGSNFIEINVSSFSEENSVSYINFMIEFIKERHKEIFEINLNQFLKKNSNKKLQTFNIILDLEEKILFETKQLIATNERRKIDMLNQISRLDILAPYLQDKIFALKKIIIEESKNLSLISNKPSLMLQNASANPTLEHIIMNYEFQLIGVQEELRDSEIRKDLLEMEIKSLDKELNISSNIFQMVQTKNNLESELENSDKLKPLTLTNSSLISEIKTIKKQINRANTIFFGFIFGLLLSLFIVTCQTFFKEWSKENII